MRTILTAVLLLCSAGGSAQTASILAYQVWEQGSEPYISRVLVTPDHVRLDEGTDGEGYTLLDRRQEILYTVSMDDRSILVMNPTGPVPEPNDELDLQHETRVDAQAPTVAGRQPNQVRLLANGELCTELVVIDGVMQDAVDGLAELKLVLARIQAVMLQNMPPGTRTPCDLASNVHAADRALQFGLPLQERSTGRSQSLVDFSPDYQADDALFELPAEFSRQPLF